MRPSLLHPLTERHSRRHRPKRRVGRLPALTHKHEAETEPASAAHEPRDIAVERVRAAGGPLDRASYTCECGYLFAAPVSTTVACPHCGVDQAW
jgi:hypothetical protein